MSLRLLGPLRLKHLVNYFLREKFVSSSVDVEVALRVGINIELTSTTTTAGDELMHALFTLFALLLLLSLLLKRCDLIFVDELGEELLLHVLLLLFSVKGLRRVRL